MLFEGQFYMEIGELKGNGQMRMLLLRGGQGQFLVYKEVERGAAEIFRRLMQQPHPNIVKICGLKAVDEEKCGIFMEYVPADTLDDKILRQGMIPLKEAKTIMLQICQAFPPAGDHPPGSEAVEPIGHSRGAGEGDGFWDRAALSEGRDLRYPDPGNGGLRGPGAVRFFPDG